MLTHSEIEEIAVECSDPFTHYIDDRERALLLDRVEVYRGIELSKPDRQAVLARACEHRAARSESRALVPMQAAVVAFPTVRARSRARAALACK